MKPIRPRTTSFARCVPHGEIPAGLRDPVVSDVPTLLLSGALDPVTPPAWAEETARTLKQRLEQV